MEYCTEQMPDYKPLSVSGYHIREAGSTAAQELAYTLADGFGYVELGLSRGMDVNRFAPGLSFFFDAHIDFFEEIAKFRAARRIWARWMRDVYGATDPRAQWLRFHTQTAGVSLTAQQPDNNVTRTAVEALAAVLGGTNSLHTNALDEVLALPSDEVRADRVAHPAGDHGGDRRHQRRRSARRQLVRRGAHRPDGGRGRARSSTGSGTWPGSRCRPAQHPIGEMTSGILRGIEDGYFTGEIADAAFAYTIAVEKGEKKVVGVNSRTGGVGDDLEILRISGEVETEQNALLARRRAGRDDARGRGRRLADLVEAARGRRQHGAGDAGRGAGRGDARRDLRRAARRVGDLHRAGPHLSHRSVEVSQSQAQCHGMRAVPRAELAEQPARMGLDGVFGKVELAADLVVGPAPAHPPQHLALAGGQVAGIVVLDAQAGRQSWPQDRIR